MNRLFLDAAQLSEETLIAPFSFKFAGVNASLGWIGKNEPSVHS